MGQQQIILMQAERYNYGSGKIASLKADKIKMTFPSKGTHTGITLSSGHVRLA